MHFLQEMEEKQVRQCQAAWQLNPYWGYVFSSCWPTTKTFDSMSDQTDKIFVKYFYNRGDTFKTEHTDNSDKLTSLEVLSTESQRPTRKMQLLES